MFLHSEIQLLKNQLDSCEALSECLIIEAYPFAKKPAPLSRAVITLSPGGISAKSCSLGQSRLFGDYTIDADVFVPQSFGSPCTSDIIENVLNAVKPLFPNAEKVSRISALDELGCFTAKCSFTFSALIKGDGYDS